MTAEHAGHGARIGARSGAVAAVLALVLGILLTSPVLPGHPTAGETAAAPGDAPTEYASVALTEVTPSTVTSSTGDSVTVSGRITNTFDRPIHDVQVRLQRAAPVRTTTDLRTTVGGDASLYGITTPYREVTGSLERGQTVDFTVKVPLSDGGLGISRAGVYPLLLNVNGTPESGGPAHLTDSRTMIPVLSLPADAGRARGWVDPASGDSGNPLLGRDGSLAANDTRPAAFTFLWPLAAPPQRAAGTTGGDTSAMRLTSDLLAKSLEPDGRLGSSLRALESLTGSGGDDPDGPGAEADDRTRRAVCVAVDPDLLQTVEGMTDGYEVTTDPARPDAPTTAGAGAQAARQWLQRLTRVASSTCVTALPYAQAGIDSLVRLDDEDLTRHALTGASDIVDRILGVTSVRGLTVPAVGTLTDQGRELLSGLDGTAGAAVASTAVEPAPVGERAPASAALGRYRSGGLPVQTYDPGVTAALGGLGGSPVVPAVMPAWQRPSLTTESDVSRRQTAVASLAFPMLDVPTPSAQPDPTPAVGPITGRSAFVVPPTYWSPTADDAQALADTIGVLVASGVAEPTPLTEVIDALPRTDATADLVTPGDVDQLTAIGFPPSTEDAADMRRTLRVTGLLENAFVESHDAPLSPQEYVQPLRDDVLRALSAPSTTDLTVYRTERSQRLGAVNATLAHMQQSVSLLDPSGRYTLASERSPLLLVVRNGLALPIKVRLDITAPDELTVGDVGSLEIPAAGTRQIQLPTRASSSQPATVRIALVTTDDLPLAAPVDLSVYANAYGKPLFYITIIAAVILVLLTARRLWHRFRGEPDPADEDRPEPDEHERHLATAGYQQRKAAERVADSDERPTDDPADRSDHPETGERA